MPRKKKFPVTQRTLFRVATHYSFESFKILFGFLIFSQFCIMRKIFQCGKYCDSALNKFCFTKKSTGTLTPASRVDDLQINVEKT
jgi:hypothetical protein